MRHYDYLIAGAGLFGCVFAERAVSAGKSVLVIDRRNHVGGNIYTEETEGITVHRYGAHIFHTSDTEVWNYVNRFAEFNHYINSPIAVYGDEVYNLPFNMNTFSRLWNIRTPKEAESIINRQRAETGITNPSNLEEQALFLAGRDVYEKLVKGYTQKQWGRPCSDLPASIIKRLPMRFTYDNNYFDDRYQGVPLDGYTKMAEKMLSGAEVLTGTDYAAFSQEKRASWDKLVYTGRIDEYFGECFGTLAYRSLRFETEVLPVDNFQGNAVVNYTGSEVPYTRIIEHKHFVFGAQEKTVITREYPASLTGGGEPYYPVNDEENNTLYERYRKLSETEKNVLFGGRLGQYRYFDMDEVIRSALDAAKKEGF